MGLLTPKGSCAGVNTGNRDKHVPAVPTVLDCRQDQPVAVCRSSHRALHSGFVPCCCYLEILNNFIFEVVLYK